MIGPDFMDEIDGGSFFDQIDDFIDFPPEDAGNVLPASDSFPPIFTGDDPSSQPLPTCVSVFSGNNSASDDISTELTVPYDEMLQLEWLSNFVEDSFSGGSNSTNLRKEISSLNSKDLTHRPFQTPSPVSVLESSNSCSRGKTLPFRPNTDVLVGIKPGRPRSKRSRPATFNPRPGLHLLSPVSSVGETPNITAAPRVPLDSENFTDSHPVSKIPKPSKGNRQKKKRKTKVLDSAVTDQNPQAAQGVRKCMHCEITKTPQWRAGPMGPKTLCNACGVRFKSGRLFPEYRPAASPTFVAALHSNSHRKVLEMRSKVGETEMVATKAKPPLATTTATVVTVAQPELTPTSGDWKAGLAGREYVGEGCS